MSEITPEEEARQIINEEVKALFLEAIALKNKIGEVAKKCKEAPIEVVDPGDRSTIMDAFSTAHDTQLALGYFINEEEGD